MVDINLPSVPLEKALEEPVEHWKELIYNAFEKPVFKLHPKIAELKNKIYVGSWLL